MDILISNLPPETSFLFWLVTNESHPPTTDASLLPAWTRDRTPSNNRSVSIDYNIHNI